MSGRLLYTAWGSPAGVGGAGKLICTPVFEQAQPQTATNRMGLNLTPLPTFPSRYKARPRSLKPSLSHGSHPSTWQVLGDRFVDGRLRGQGVSREGAKPEKGH